MKKIQTQQDEAKKQQKPRPKSESKAKSSEEIEKSLCSYFDKRFNEIDQSMADKMSTAILHAHQERKELRRTNKRSKDAKRSKEISQSIESSAQHIEESKRSSK